MAGAPTMNDVAREAGVALKTVSRYVNGATNVDPVLAERIRAAIEQLGYRRNLVAASIRPGWRSRVVGLIIGDLANPYYSELARAIERVAVEHGYLLVTASSEESGELHDRLVDRLLDQRVDGLVVVPPRDDCRPWNTVRPPRPPLVFVDRPDRDGVGDSIVGDNAGGARAAVAALADAGARRIASVGDALEIATMAERLSGYRAELAARGLPTGPDLEHTTAHDTAEARAIVGAILESGTADAVFAGNNRAAVGALLAFRDHGRRLPLVGFDEFETAAVSDPPTSVVAYDVAALGDLAARLLFARLEGGADEPTTRVLPSTLTLRGSERPD